MPDEGAQDFAFAADLIGGRRGHDDGLRVNHLAHHSARAIGRSHQHRVDIQLLRGNALQAAEQGVR